MENKTNNFKNWCLENGAYGQKLLKEFISCEDLKVEELAPHSNKLAFWRCSKCGHEWEARVNSRTSKSRCGCPYCNRKNRTSYGQEVLYFILKRELPQYEVRNSYKYFGNEIDIYIPALKFGVEYGSTYYHGSDEQYWKDREKKEYLEGQGISLEVVIEKTNNEYSGLKSNFEFNRNKDSEFISPREYIRGVMKEKFDLDIEINLSKEEVREIRDRAGLNDLDDLDLLLLKLEYKRLSARKAGRELGYERSTIIKRRERLVELGYMTPEEARLKKKR